MRMILLFALLCSVAQATVHVTPGTSVDTIQTYLDQDGHVVLQKGIHVIHGLSLSNCRLEAVQGALVHVPAGAFATVNGNHVQVEGIHAIGTGGEAFIRLDATVSRLRVLSCETSNLEWLLDDSTASNVTVIRVEDCIGTMARVKLHNSKGYIRLEDVLLDHTPHTVTGTVVDIQNAEGVNLTRVHVDGNGDINNPNPATAFYLQGWSIECDGCMADTIPGYGFHATGAHYARFSDCDVSLCTHVGFHLESSVNVHIDGLNVWGRNHSGLTTVPNQANIEIHPGCDYRLGTHWSRYATGTDTINPSVN